MDHATYFEWVDRLTRWAVEQPSVVGFVAVGSTADTHHSPDEFSDHDLIVVTRDGSATGLRVNLAWLPDPDRIVMVHDETEHGRGVIYDDGHLIEVAVLDDHEIERVSLNAYRILIDRADLTPRLEAIAERTTAVAAADDLDGSYRLHTFVEQLIVGLSRSARGELLSAHQRIHGPVATALIGLLGTFVPSKHQHLRDSLDPHRRFEQVHPELAAQVTAALNAPLHAAAVQLLAIAEAHLIGNVAAATPAVFDAVRAITGTHPEHNPV